VARKIVNEALLEVLENAKNAAEGLPSRNDWQRRWLEYRRINMEFLRGRDFWGKKT
jgi:hypothetical protein